MTDARRSGRSQLFRPSWLLREGGLEVVSVHPRDELQPDFLWANGLAFAVIGTTSEAFRVHLVDHRGDAAEPFGLALRERVQVPNLRGDK